jgi:predicted enzyme related to lactoylglutathione lyase
MSAPPSRFIRHDLMSADAPAAARFYGDLFGWVTTDVSVMGSTVVRLSLGERVLGAVMPFNMGPAFPSHWVPYVHVESVEECCRRISALGGDVCIGATEIPPGRFAVVNDPQKAIFSPFTPKVAPPAVPEASPRAGDFCWDELLTSDVAGATAFYTSLFGWGTSEMDAGAAGTYTLLTIGGAGIAGVMRAPADVAVVRRRRRRRRHGGAGREAGRHDRRPALGRSRRRQARRHPRRDGSFARDLQEGDPISRVHEMI